MKKIFILLFLCVVLTSCASDSKNQSENAKTDEVSDFQEDNIIINETIQNNSAYDDTGIFVSPSGDNQSGDGTIEKPYKTIQHVLDNIAQSGDTIILRKGTYNEEVRIRNPRITIRSKSDEWAKIAQPVTIDGNNVVIPVIFDVDSDGSKLQRIEVTGGFYGIMLFTKWEWGEDDRSGATDIVIEDCIIHDTGVDAIKVTPGSDNLIIRHCEIYNSGAGYPAGTPLEDMNAEGIDVVNADNVLIQDNYIHHTATTCVYLKGGARNGVIERVKAEHCGALGIVLGFDTSPEWFDLTENPDYYENINSIVRNNIVSDTNYAGIGLYASKNAQVYNNTIVNTAKLAHSPIYFGLTYQDWDDNAKRPGNINPIIKNNIVLQEEDINSPCVSIRYSDDLGGMSALNGDVLMDYNVYYRASGSCTFVDMRPGSLLEDASFATWRGHIKGEANSMETDPMLNDSYHLTQGSPSIDKGESIDLVAFDIDGNARTGLYDIGADEFEK